MSPKTICPNCGKTYEHLFVGETCSACNFTVKVIAAPEPAKVAFDEGQR